MVVAIGDRIRESGAPRQREGWVLLRQNSADNRAHLRQPRAITERRHKDHTGGRPAAPCAPPSPGLPAPGISAHAYLSRSACSCFSETKRIPERITHTHTHTHTHIHTRARAHTCTPPGALAPFDASWRPPLIPRRPAPSHARAPLSKPRLTSQLLSQPLPPRSPPLGRPHRVRSANHPVSRASRAVFAKQGMTPPRCTARGPTVHNENAAQNGLACTGRCLTFRRTQCAQSQLRPAQRLGRIRTCASFGVRKRMADTRVIGK